ncbi:unnamed protein product [Ascophyllum nodosum]
MKVVAEQRFKERAFLDDPLLYPEFAVLVQRQNLQHRFRHALHRFRTPALVALAACSVILSGAVAPSPPWCGVFVCDGDRKASTISDWADFLGKGLALDLLGRHFEGVASALACISIMTCIVLLVYPLQRWAPTAASMIGQPLATPMFSSLAVAMPCALACGVALWAEGLFHWGFASAMAVGLMTANLTLKATSFAKTSCGLSNAAKIVSDTPAVGEDLIQLTFAEFVFFIVAAPSLVCVPRFLRRRALRSPRVTRALCEFSHAALSFLAIHAVWSAMYAPTLRVIAAATMAALEHQAESTWIDPVGWEALPDGGGARWFCELVEALGGRQVIKDGGMLTCNAAPAWLQTTLAAVFGMMVFSPMTHFMASYGFWHCTCLGCAELWGYPDRHFYGPWWLITDDLRTFFRTWSTPVHRWLVSCVHTPILSCDVPTACVPTGGDPANSSADLMKGGESPTAAASTNGEGFGEGQTPSGELGSQDGIGKAGTATSGWRLLALVSVFMFSSVVHEVVLFVAMRRTCWPINSFSLMTSVVFVAAWDKIFPPKYLIHEDSKRTEVEGENRNQTHALSPPARARHLAQRNPPPLTHSKSTAGLSCKTPAQKPPAETGKRAAQSTAQYSDSAVSNGQLKLNPSNTSCALSRTPCATGGSEPVSKAGPEKGSVTPRPAIGSYRGWFAVVFYLVTSLPLTLLVDYLVWQWWRQAVMVR